MKITKLSQYKGTTMLLETDKGNKLYIGKKTAEKMNLCVGMELPDSALSAIGEEDIERKSRERAMYLLAERDYGFAELYHKLQKNYPDEMCLRTCRLMAEKGFVNDRDYAFKLGRQYFEIKKESAIAVRYKLTQKGIPRYIIDEVIEEYCTDDAVKERICELIQKKYSRRLDDEEGRRRVRNALARHGFSYSDINAAMQEFFDEK